MSGDRDVAHTLRKISTLHLFARALLKERIAASLVPRAVEQSFAKVTLEVTQRVDKLKAELEVFDPTLAAAVASLGRGWQKIEM